MTAQAQLSPHGGDRVDLATRQGPLAALRGPEPSASESALGTVLFVPGYTGSKEDFAPLLDGCAAAGLTPIAIDLPGQFESPGPADEAAYSPAALGSVVAEVVAELAKAGPVLLLGHSYGGLVARAAVLGGAVVAGLTLLDSGPGALPDGVRRRALAVGEPLLRSEGMAAAYDLRQRLSGDVPGDADELRAFLRTRFLASSSAGLLGMAHWLRNEPDRVAELAGTLRGREVPCLVVAGAQDDAWDVPAQRDMATRLAAPFALLEAAAHSPNTENPKGLLDILLPTWRGWLTR